MAQHRRRNIRKKRSSPIKRFAIFVLVAAVIAIIISFVVNNYNKAQRLLGRAMYPLKYSEYVDKAADEYNVEKELVYAMIYTESHFNEDAVSSAGAVGLMQVTPDTYDWLCRKRGIEMIDGGLYDPAVNIDFGTYLISYLFDEFNDEKLVIAAYNAGPDNVKKWLKDFDYSTDGKTLSKIPYTETERHVKKVLDAKEKYKYLYFS